MGDGRWKGVANAIGPRAGQRVVTEPVQNEATGYRGGGGAGAQRKALLGDLWRDYLLAAAAGKEPGEGEKSSQ